MAAGARFVICWGIFVGLLMSMGIANLAAQTQELINEIEVTGNQRIEAETVRSYLGLRAGEDYDPARANDALKRLFATGLFADVALRYDGGRLTVAVEENPIINRLAFEGNRRLQDDLLEEEVQLRPRVVYTRGRVQSDVQRILQIYQRNGRFAVTVEPKVIQLDQNRIDLVFEIDEGALTGIRRIEFIGNKAFSDGRLKSELATKETRWYRFLTSDDVYDPDRITADQELLRRFYLSKGYADFRVDSALAELTRDREAFFITFTLSEGERYNVGAIDIKASLKDLDAEALREQIEIEPGEIYNADLVEDSIQGITESLGELGYAFVDVRPQAERDRENKLVDLTFDVREGPRVYVERINITGNVRTLDRVIRREFRLAEGDAFNTAKVRRSQQRIRSLGFFRSAKVGRKRGSADDKVEIEVEVEEQSTGELSFGAGFSTAESVIGDVSIRERNLLGRGQDLRLSLAVSKARQQLDLSFTEPYFLDRDIAAGFDVFKIDRDLQDRSSLDVESLGLRLRSTLNWTERLEQGFRYTLRQDDISDVREDASEFIRREQGESITSSIGYDLTYDRRDDALEPHEGYLLGFGQDLAGLGGDVHFVRSTARAGFYYPISDTFTGVLSVRSGHIQGIGEDVEVNNRFFIGGDSFRGFESGGIGPRDAVTDDSIGANIYYVGTAELRFPIPVAEEFGFTGRVFAIGGSLFEVDVSGANLLESGDPRFSAGIGASWRSPFGPIRVDFARPIVEESFDKDELFRLSFGTRF